MPRLVPHAALGGPLGDRRLNVIGADFSHGPQAGQLAFTTPARVPLPQRLPDGRYKKPFAEVAVAHGLPEEDLGTLDGDVFLAFVWHLAGRPVEVGELWRRERPLMVVVDNYSVHKNERVRYEQRALTAADVHLVYLPAYCPELSRMEAHRKVAKYHDLPRRSYPSLGDLQQAVERTLALRAMELCDAHTETAQSSARTP